MSYHVYTTEAFILDRRSRGEADRLFYLFTKDLGLIRAVATGVRLQKSKLAGHLNNYSYIKVSVIRGKEIWRITDASTNELGVYLLGQADSREVYVRFLAFIKRMVFGEEVDERTFDVLLKAFVSLGKIIKSGEKVDVRVFEALLMIRLLRQLGYMRKTGDLEQFLDDDEYTPDRINAFSELRALAVKEINTALKTSHL